MLTGISDEYNAALAGELDRQFSQWLTEQLYLAFTQARAGKRRTRDEGTFEAMAMENIMSLREDILERTFKPGRGIAFIVNRPVVREIFAAPFRDRVVHHFLYNQVCPWWDRRMITDSYSCRIGKGTLYGVERLARYIRKISRNYTIETYVIKLDIQGYFMSLRRDRLYERIKWGLERQYPDGGRICEIVDYLWREVIFDDPTEGVQLRGNWEKLKKKLPKEKSLFCQPPGQGIVIGNLSSQLLSNIYMDKFDQFVKHELKYKAYGRYVDDFYIVVTKDELGKALRDVKVMEDFLREMGLTLHPRKRYVQEINRGVQFLGARIYPGRILPGYRVMKFFREAARLKTLDENYIASMNSYLGHTSHFDSKAMVSEVFEEMGWDYRF